VSHVVVTDQAFGGVEQERAMAAAAGAEFTSHQCTTEEETLEAVRDADVALVNFAPMTEKVLSAMGAGATVVRYGIGYDNVDVEAARRLGVAVANVPDYGSDTVADHAAAMILALLRRLPHYDRSIRAGGWCPPASVGPVPSFSSSTVGLVGVGRIARSLAARLAGFGFDLIGFDPLVPADVAEAAGVRLVSLDEVAERSHAVSLHVPSTPETHRLVNAAFIARMREGAVVVNTSRGSLVDEQDLAAALLEGRLAGAALDVFDPEPLAAESPLRDCPTVLFTPHAAFYSTQSLQNLQRLATEEAARALRSEPLRCPVT
jgi:D-3-phosphoglycerate dehydrogenase / 2-oxoglutarate reductase